MDIESKTNIQIPIAVYAYNRNKKLTDANAVKRIGFYDKRKVKEETKFQNYYVRAKAVPSRLVFKEEQEFLINRDNALVAINKKKKEELEKRRQDDDELIYENKYYKTKQYILNSFKDQYNVYIPIKYYKTNATQITQNIDGLLAFSGAWHMYNGNNKNVDMYYLPKERQWAEYTLYETKRRIVLPKDNDNDGRFSDKEIRNGYRESVLQNLRNLFDCKDVEWYYLGISHAICLSSIGSILYLNTTALLASGSLLLGEIVSKAAQYIINFFKSFGNQSSTGLAPDVAATWEGVASAAGYAWEMLPILKSEDKAAFVAWAARVYNFASNETADETSIMDMLRNLGNEMLQQGSEILNALYDILETYLAPIFTGFIQFCENGASVLGRNPGSFIKQATSTALNLTGAGGYINIILFMVGLLDGTYDSKIGTSIYRAYEGLVCLIANIMKYVKEFALIDFINPFLGREHKKLILEGFKFWKEAKEKLTNYAALERITLNMIEKKEKTPRFILQQLATKRTIYSELGSKAQLQSVIINKDAVPYVYVVAEGTKTVREIRPNGLYKTKEEKYWYFYMYKYDPRKKEWIFAIYETNKIYQKKKTLSSPIPAEVGGEFCRRRLNGITVSGIPFPFYLAGMSLAPLLGGYIIAFFTRFANGALWSSMKLERWTPDAVRNVLVYLKDSPSDGYVASFLRGVSMWLVWSNKFVNILEAPEDGARSYFLQIQFLRDVLTALMQQWQTIAVLVGVNIAQRNNMFDWVGQNMPGQLAAYQNIPILLYNLWKRLIEILPCAIGVFLYNRIYKNRQDYRFFE